MSDLHFNYLDAETPGEQPIRVFYEMILNEFQEIKNILITQFPESDLNSLRLSFLTENIKAIGPNVNKSRIQIHDTFLSFLWSYCYSSITIMPDRDKEFNKSELDKAYALLKYSKQIIFEQYEDWPKELPNPENSKDHNQHYVAVGNSLFITSTIIILYHEFAHIVLKHIYEKDRSIQKMQEMEYEADRFAIDLIKKTTPTLNEETINAAVILAISSLTFSIDKFNDARYHPEPEDRLTKILEYLNYPFDNHIWNIATMALLEWMLHFGKFDGKTNLHDERHYYFAILNQVRNSKNK